MISTRTIVPIVVLKVKSQKPAVCTITPRIGVQKQPIKNHSRPLTIQGISRTSRSDNKMTLHPNTNTKGVFHPKYTVPTRISTPTVRKESTSKNQARNLQELWTSI